MTKFKYELDYETQKKYISFHLFNHKKLHVSPIILSIALVGFGILSIVLKQYLLAIVSGILIIVVLGFLFFLTRKVFKMNLKGKEFPVQNVSIGFTKEGMTLYDDLSDNKQFVEYHKLHRIYFLKDYVYIYLTQDQGIALQKALLVEGDYDKFALELKENLNKRLLKFRGYKC
ncbi:MAG TPA: hypothetical protein GXZ51_03545 [Acholeplasma sp.]|nr:hypothetical protein [Acholeplasma sp.]